MLAQLNTVLIKEAIKLAFRLVEYLEHQHLWVRLKAQYGEYLVSLYLLWERKAIPCGKLPRNWRSNTTLCTTPFTEQCKMALTRTERGVGGPGAQLSKRTSTLECLVWETDASQVLNWQLHKTTHKTPVSKSTVKRWLRDGGLLGKDAKKKAYLRLANKRKD